jgi:hypothetical protein
MVMFTLVFVLLARVPVSMRQSEKSFEHEKSKQTRQHDQSDIPGRYLDHGFRKEAYERCAQESAHCVREQNRFETQVQLGKGDQRSRPGQGSHACEQAKDQYVRQWHSALTPGQHVCRLTNKSISCDSH